MTAPAKDVDDLVSTLPWEKPRGYDFKHVKYVNLQETFAVLDELLFRVRSGHIGSVLWLVSARVWFWVFWRRDDHPLSN